MEQVRRLQTVLLLYRKNQCKDTGFEKMLLPKCQSNDIENYLISFQVFPIGSAVCSALIDHSFPLKWENFCRSLQSELNGKQDIPLFSSLVIMTFICVHASRPVGRIESPLTMLFIQRTGLSLPLRE